MKCPYCFYKKSGVVDKRNTDENSTIRRRRECLKCKKRFTTYEKLGGIELKIVKQDGRVEDFDREKITNGIMRACEKRNISAKKISEFAEQIERELLKLGEPQISSRKIGEIVMKKLKTFDEVAYIRFASVYREFQDSQEFLKEISLIKKNKKVKR